MGKLLSSLPGGARSTRDVQNALGIDTALAWQIFRVGSLPDPVLAGPDVPRPGPMAKALRAALSKGVPKDIVDEVQAACDAFERMVEHHAGERGTFDSMVRGLRPETPQVPLKDRRDAYRTNTSIWGLQAQATYSLTAYYPNQDGKTEDRAAVWGYIALRSLRAGPPAHVIKLKASAWSSQKQGLGEQVPPSRSSLDILTDFSTQPLPPIEVGEAEPGTISLKFSTEVVGRTGDATYFMRDVARSIGPYPQPWWGMGFTARIPTEFLILDMLVPVGWSDPASIRVDTYCDFYQRASKCLDEDRMPITEAAVHIGQSLVGLRSPHVPNCPEMVSKVLRDLGLGETRFDIFRCVVQYPVMFSGIAMRVGAAR